MPPAAALLSFSWALGSFLRLSAARRRAVRRRRLLRRMVALLEQTQSGHPVAYCKLNQDVPILRLWFNVEAELQQDFRLSRRAVRGVQRLLQRDQDHGWGSQLEVLIYVYWLAHGLSYRLVSSVFSVPKSTVHRVIHRVARLIWRNLRLAIHFPEPEDLRAVGEGFGRLSGTPVLQCVAGAIDGCHFRVKPPSQHQVDYVNDKGFCSINMQAICDSKGKFLDIFVGYPGSVHAAHIMTNSTFYRTQAYPPPDYVLLGDGGYPCLDQPISLITPYDDPVTGQTESRFNHHHGRGRSSAQRAFGVMKTRWRSTLFRGLEVSPAFSPVVIASCAFLHNVCLENGDLLEPDSDVALDVLAPPPPGDALLANQRSGRARRDRLAALISGQAQQGPH